MKKFESLSDNKFNKFNQFEKSELDNIKGGEEATLPWNDTNQSKESSTLIDIETSYLKDSTRTEDDTVPTLVQFDSND